MRSLVAEDSSMSVWWVTVVECTSAIARRERSSPPAAKSAAAALSALSRLSKSWIEVPPTERLREHARRIVRLHDLRAADALQLAAAHVASDGQPESLSLVTLDERLAVAARREGFPVLGL
jgi:predicted nucleic acid-binding protein